MELARVIGNVVATVKDASLTGYKLLIVQPLDHHLNEVDDPLVVVDPLQAGAGELVAWIGGKEASLAMPHDLSPVDAAIVEIIDEVDAPKGPLPPVDLTGGARQA